MNKKGFTLIEIIISMSLIVIIGSVTFITINKIDKNKQSKIYDKFTDALSVYLSEHKEVYSNLKDNAEGAIVSLEVLKNEGLIKDNIIDPKTNKKIDYKNDYYLLSDAVLTSNDEDSKKSDCKGQVEISIIASWDDLKEKVDTSKILYICPKTSTVTEDDKVKSLEARIGQLESQFSNGTSIYTDSNPNNWVYFDVTSNENDTAYWPNNNKKNKWRIYNYKVNYEDGQRIIYPIKLVYSQNVIANNDKLVNDTTYNYPTTLYKSSTSSDYDAYQKSNRSTYYYKALNCYQLYYCNNSYKCNDGYYQSSSNVYLSFKNGSRSATASTALSLGNISKAYCQMKNSTYSTYYYSFSDVNGFYYADFSKSLVQSDGTYSNDTKKYYLYNNIIHKDFVSVSNYYSLYSVSGDIVFQNYSDSITEKLGVLSKDEINVITDKNNWMANLYSGKYIGTGSYSFDDYIMFYNKDTGLAGGSKITYRDSRSKYDISTYKYVPVIKMQDGVKITGGTGTEDDPFVLSYNDVTSH